MPYAINLRFLVIVITYTFDNLATLFFKLCFATKLLLWNILYWRDAKNHIKICFVKFAISRQIYDSKPTLYRTVGVFEQREQIFNILICGKYTAGACFNSVNTV